MMTLRLKATEYLLVGGAAILAFVVGCLVSASGEGYWMIPIAAAIGTYVAIATFVSPQVGFYALVASAMLNYFGIPIGEVHLRPDQVMLVPVLTGLALHFAARSAKRTSRSALRPQAAVVPVTVITGFALFIGLNALSSFLFSPQPAESFQIVIWLSLSFLALAATYVVVGTYISVRQALLVVLAAGFASATVGVLLFILYQLTGANLGIQHDPGTAVSRVHGTFFEANIFGSFQAFCAVAGMALIQLRQVRALSWIGAGTALSAVALVLSFTRAAWLGFFAGIVLLALFQLRGGRILILAARSITVVAVTLLALGVPGLFATFATRLADTDTVDIRLYYARLAVTEWASSPLLGLGTNSFGQRHLDPSLNYQEPVYLFSLFLAALYDVGLVGLLILLGVFAVVGGTLVFIRLKTGSSWYGSFALALLCGLVALLVSYQATSAFWFSYNWIIIGVALRFYQMWRTARNPS